MWFNVIFVALTCQTFFLLRGVDARSCFCKPSENEDFYDVKEPPPETSAPPPRPETSSPPPPPEEQDEEHDEVVLPSPPPEEPDEDERPPPTTEEPSETENDSPFKSFDTSPITDSRWSTPSFLPNWRTD